MLLFFVAGLFGGLRFPILPLELLLMAGLSAGAAFLFRKQSRRSLPFFWAAIFLIGWSHAGIVVLRLAPDELGRLMDRPREQLVVRGRVIDHPVRVEESPGETGTWHLTVQADAVNRLGSFESASGRIDVQMQATEVDRPPQYGERWEWTGVVRRRAQYQWQWSFLPPYRMRVRADEAERLSVGHGTWLKRWSFAGRSRAADLLGAGLEAYPETAGILRALLLGYRHELPEEHETLFAWTGTLHIFAISGLHVGILAGLILLVVRAFGVARPYWILFVGPLLVVYAVSTGLRPSALRACAMAIAFGSAYLFYRKPDAPSAWALAALLILAASPTQLTAPGFIFSFVIVAGLIRLYPPIYRFIESRFRPDPYVLQSPDAGPGIGARAGPWLAGLLAASIAAWLASAPLTAHYFNLFSPVALLGNLLVIPAAFIVVLTGVLALLTGTVSIVGAEIFNHANRVFLDGLLWFIERLAAVPGGHQFVGSPSLFWIGVWYAFLFGGLLWTTSTVRRWGYAVLTGCVLIGGLYELWPGPARMDLVATGDGHAVLIRSGDDRILFDAGPAYQGDRLIDALRRRGVNRLDVLILSHASAQHAGGAPAVLEAMPVNEVWSTAYESRSPAYDKALQTAAAQGIPIRKLERGANGAWDHGLAWEVVHPADAVSHSRAADASLVLRVSRGTHAVLLMGGAGGEPEARMLAAGIDPAATIVVIGNQGQDDSASVDWLQAVRPDAVVIDVSRYNRHGYPERDVVERILADPARTVWRTDEQGAVTVTLQSRIRRGRQKDQWTIASQWGTEADGL